MISDKVRKDFEGLLAAAGVTQPPPAGEGEPAPAPAGSPRIVPTEYAARGFHLDATVVPDQVVAAAELLDRHGFSLMAVTGVDWLKEGQMEVVYDYLHWQEQCRVAVRARIDRGAPALPSVQGIFPGANWHERETHDFFGIVFEGHPDLTPLLLPEDADFHPLLKDYKP
ncbi:MAG: NADH-quinone oxidoreductase subunit C [Thermodesulfobacteriota bacterium]